MLDLSDTTLPQQIQANLIAYMRNFIGLPGVFAVDEEDLFWIISNQGAPGNVVLKSDFTEGSVDERIEAVFSAFPSSASHCDWFVFPHSPSHSLGPRLAARGMMGGRGGNWLWGDLTKLPAMSQMPNSFRIAPVQGDVMMEQWVRVSSAGFQIALPLYFSAYSRFGYDAAAPMRQFIGYIDDMPVTSGTLLEAGGCAVIYDISTPPDKRGRGFGSAITLYMLQCALQHGYSESWIWSSDQARGLYRSLGFVDADFGLREHSWLRK